MNKYFKKLGDNSFIYEKLDERDVRTEILEPGIYTIWDIGSMMTGIIPQFEPIRELDKLVKFKTGIIAEVIRTTDKFFSKETRAIYEELKVAHKMGILFHGKAGTGKTSTCMLIMKELVDKHDAICLNATGKSLSFITYTVDKLREAQQNPVVIFVDEFDSRLKREEEGYLSFLDGTASINNSIFIGCTNYIDRIPDRFKKRKSRIKDLHCINSLPEMVYREYLVDRAPHMKKESIAEFTHYAVEYGLTIDQLKHALLDHKIEGFSIEEAIDNSMKFNDKEPEKKPE